MYRLCAFFGDCGTQGLRWIAETDPELWERIERREPNAYLVLLYWDSEMFRRNTRKRRELETDTEQKDYKALVKDILYLNTEKYTIAKDTKKRLSNWRSLFVKTYGIATQAEVIAGIDTVGRCVNTTGTIPDLILAPGWSHEKDVAALMATKAAAISGHFVAKALVDLGCGEGGAKTFDAVQAEKEKNALADRAQVVCWPMVTWEGKRCHLSVRIAGLLARRDRENGSPYDSPSNLPIYIDGACLEDGTEVTLSVEEANTVESAGVVTVLNFVNGWTSWGNFTAAHDPAKAVADEDPKDVLISTGRMLDWIGNTVQKTFWDRVDRPMNRIFVDAIVDATNIWLGGLVGNALLGARVDAPDSMNPPKELEAGHVQVKIAEASPPPARIIDFVTEFDRSLVSAAFAE